MTKGHDYTDKRTGIVYTNVTITQPQSHQTQPQKQLDAFISDEFLNRYFEKSKLGTDSI